jgi:hypothetical protein
MKQVCFWKLYKLNLCKWNSNKLGWLLFGGTLPLISLWCESSPHSHFVCSLSLLFICWVCPKQDPAVLNYDRYSPTVASNSQLRGFESVCLTFAASCKTEFHWLQIPYIPCTLVQQLSGNALFKLCLLVICILTVIAHSLKKYFRPSIEWRVSQNCMETSRNETPHR